MRPRTISAEAGKPLKAARVEVARAMSTYTMAAVQARTLAGEMVPMDASQAGEGKLAFTLRRPDRRRRRDLTVQLPAQPRRAQDRAGARRRLRGRAQARLADAAVGAPACRARARGRPAGGLAQRRRRPVGRDRRRPRRRRARQADHLHRLRRRRLEAPRAGARKRVNLELGNATPVIVEADADVEDAATRCAANAFSFAGQSCISVQRIYVHADVYDDFKARFLPKVEALQVGDPADEDDRRRPADPPGERERVLDVDRGRATSRRDDPHGRRARRRAARADGGRAAAADSHLACDEAFGPVCTLQPYETLDEAIALANGTRYGLQAGIFTATVQTAIRAPLRSSSAGSPSTRRRRSAPTRCPTAVSRTPATPARARRGRCAR